MVCPRVTVTITGGPSGVEVKEMPRHKKNPAVGNKNTVYSSQIIIDQADAKAMAINEEVGILYIYLGRSDV